MATPSRVINVPKPAKGSYNHHRLLSKNLLILNQVKHFHEVEKTLPPEQQSGMNVADIKTEGQAAEYIRRITAVLHPKVQKAT